jgi:enoyl-CoA hydratase/carnithine racemase
MDAREAGVRVQVSAAGGRGRVAHVTLDHEAKANSLTSPLLLELAAAFERLAADDALRAAVLTGAGSRAFIGGANLDELAALDVESARAYIGKVHRACAAIRALPVPVIARINGHCLGAGLEIAAACDLRLASANAVFAMPEVKLGLPSVVEAALLPRLVGWGKAAEIVYLARNYDAAAALAMGLVEHVAEPGELDAAVSLWLDDLLAAGPLAIRAQKALLAEWERLPLEAAIEAGAARLAAAYASDEPRRMIEAISQRRRAGTD